MTATGLNRLMLRLADGDWHRVDDPLAARDQLADVGIQLETDSDGRSRLADPVHLLDAKRITGHLDAVARDCISRLDVHSIIDSTNSELQRQPPPPPGNAHVCLAEFQNAGRGRRGRAWVAPFGHALCLSVAWHFGQPPRHLSALSLAVGVSAVRALRDFGVDSVMLKWPNDLYFDGRKLGGVLIDAQGSIDDMCVVAGVGLNLKLGPDQQRQIAGLKGAEPAALASISGALERQRNQLAAALTSHVITMLTQFGSDGLAPWADEWREADMLRGRVVEVNGPDRSYSGRALGVDESGALLVQQGEHLRRVVAAEVSVRPQ